MLDTGHHDFERLKDFERSLEVAHLSVVGNDPPDRRRLAERAMIACLLDLGRQFLRDGILEVVSIPAGMKPTPAQVVYATAAIQHGALHIPCSLLVHQEPFLRKATGAIDHHVRWDVVLPAANNGRVDFVVLSFCEIDAKRPEALPARHLLLHAAIVRPDPAGTLGVAFEHLSRRSFCPVYHQVTTDEALEDEGLDLICEALALAGLLSHSAGRA